MYHGHVYRNIQWWSYVEEKNIRLSCDEYDTSKTEHFFNEKKEHLMV